jgi:DNA-binding GntR family transcriptional regulator
MAGRGVGEQEAHTLTARLAAQIIERARYLDLPADSHLTEQELANAFQVSRTPVRLALHALADMGLVERRPNRGFFLKRVTGEHGDGVGAIPATLDGADEDPLYFRMAEDRLTGKLEPKVEEAEVARRYGASRARVARLLARMAQEGWVSRLPGHGWAFQPLLTSPESYDQGYRYRMLIEPAAVLESGYTVNPAAFSQARAQQMAMLEGGIRRWSRSETFTANSGFHEVIVAGSGNLFLLEGLRRVNRLRRLLEYRTHVFKDRLVQECRDHLVLLDMIEGGRRTQAAEFLHEHLNRARLAKAAIIEGRATSSSP